MKYILVGYDKNRAIGARNTLPWMGKMKTDMQRVKELTTGNAIIMGRTTYESIGRALPNRQNIVITHRPFEAADVDVVASLDAAYARVEQGRDIYIFGGAQIYRLAIDTVDQIVATEVDAVIDGTDTFFPPLDSGKWQEITREHHERDIDNAYGFDFVTYEHR